ncbi:hypothetical protein GQ600_828 [Phytophthora cactorum]|nr:hypothetical protein GQ600_828 [Phytophthora cactorum]
MEQLRRDKEYASDPDVAVIVNLIEQSSLSQSSRARALSRRHSSRPVTTFVDSLLDGVTTGMAALR